MDVACDLYYFTLQRLDRLANFEDVLETMLDVLKTVYRDPKEQTSKITAVTPGKYSRTMRSLMIATFGASAASRAVR